MRPGSRLLAEISPYLHQHASDLVKWFPFTPEALARAQAEDKPIVLSIGYAGCHWCRVMGQECFQDESIAAQMNDHFICVLVDREERPDLDRIYMNATVALHGRGGWPMTVFLTPTGEPFFAGTYFPPRDGEHGPGFLSLLDRIARMWKEDRETLRNQASELVGHIRATHRRPTPTGLTEDAIFAAVKTLHKDFDLSYGGFGDAPKFPPCAALGLLLRQHRRTRQKELRTMVERTLDMMMSGGLYDQLAGGFVRYCVDNKWLVPRFEKTLSDNALLADIYLEAYQVTGRASYRAVARETLDYLLREMQSPAGGFFTSYGADGESGEGDYYLWTRQEIRGLLGEPAATHFCEFFGIAEQGPLGGKNVPSTRRRLKDVARQLGAPETELVSSIEAARALLLEARGIRQAPPLDDQVLCAHNGLAIRALANAARAFSDYAYLEAAQRTADFVLGSAEDGHGMRARDGRLLRAYRGGHAQGRAFLEDYAYLADGLLSLYEAGGGAYYFEVSLALAERMVKDFSEEPADEAAPRALYSTTKDHEAMISRPITGHDDALPNDNAISARVLLRLAAHTGDAAFRQQGLDILQAFSTGMKRSPRAYCSMLSVVDFLLEPCLEVVLCGSPTNETYREMAQLLGSSFLPHRVEARLDEKSDEIVRSPLTLGKFEDGKTQAFLCRDGVCRAPCTSAQQLNEGLARLSEESGKERRRELFKRIVVGRASSEGTAQVKNASGLPHTAYAQLQGLWVSRLGLGTLRVGLDAAEHRRAVRQALLAGINLVDTSPSFAFGDSERLVGQVLEELIAERAITRDQLVLVSKVGVAVGPLAAELEQLRLEGRLPQPTVPLTTGGPPIEDASLESGAYCLHPRFLVEQVESILGRLGVSHLDICLIQSPEHLLAARVSPEDTYQALADACAALEGLVREGKVGCYGVLSNTLTHAGDAPLGLALERVLEAAHSAGTSNHFRVLELPINLVENGALRAVSGPCLLTRAREAGLSVLSCRPLSVMTDQALLRLVDPPRRAGDDHVPELSKARYRVASLEAEFETTFAAALRLAGRVGPEPVLPVSGALGQVVERVETLAQFDHAEKAILTPRLRRVLSHLDQAMDPEQEPTWLKFRSKYVEAIGVWLHSLRESARRKTMARLEGIQESIADSPFAAHVGPAWDVSPWIHRAIEPLLAVEGITSVLLGMRSEHHVEQAIALLTPVTATDS